MTDDRSLADAVQAAAAARARRGQLESQLTAARGLATARRDELAAARARHTVELADVHRLEGFSPTRVWAALRGNADERLAVEQAEAHVAAQAVAAAQQRFDHAQADAERIQAEYDGLRDAHHSYAAALAAYEESLRTQGGAAGETLARLAAQLGEATAEQREIDEALAAQHVAVRALDTALATLSSAGGWATYDTFFGGGIVADLVKHSKIADATAAFTDVNRALERLTTELADIGAPPVQGVEISQSLAVFDVLFDNVVSDWMVRDRIAQARVRAEELRGRLDHLQRYLSLRSSDVASRLATLAREREGVLLTTR